VSKAAWRLAILTATDHLGHALFAVQGFPGLVPYLAPPDADLKLGGLYKVLVNASREITDAVPAGDGDAG
jgi:hypothetical protein